MFENDSGTPTYSYLMSNSDSNFLPIATTLSKKQETQHHVSTYPELPSELRKLVTPKAITTFMQYLSNFKYFKKPYFQKVSLTARKYKVERCELTIIVNDKLYRIRIEESKI